MVDSVTKNGLLNQLSDFRFRISELNSQLSNGEIDENIYKEKISELSEEISILEEYVNNLFEENGNE